MEPVAGIFLWVRLPNGVDAVDLARQAIAEGIVLAPGPVFSTSGGWRSHMRFNVAMSDDDRVSAFLHKALAWSVAGQTAASAHMRRCYFEVGPNFRATVSDRKMMRPMRRLVHDRKPMQYPVALLPRRL